MRWVGSGFLQHREQFLDKANMLELPGTDVHGQRQQFGVCMARPPCQFDASGAQNPGTQWHDEAGGLGNSNEVVRVDPSTHRVPPTHQDLGANELATGFHLGLVVQYKLLLRQCLAHIGLQSSTLCHGFLGAQIEEAEGVASLRLGLVHRQVPAFEQFFHAAGRIDIERYAHTARGVVHAPIKHEYFAKHVEHGACNRLGLHRGLGTFCTQAFQQHHELISAQACNGIAPASTLFKPLGHLPEQFVACLVAQCVVEILEVVEVHHQQGTAEAAGLAVGKTALQPVGHQAAIGQASERIVVSQRANLILCGLALRDVHLRADVMRDLACRRTHLGDVDPGRVNVPAFALQPHFARPVAVLGHRIPDRRVERGVIAS